MERQSNGLEYLTRQSKEEAEIGLDKLSQNRRLWADDKILVV